MAKYTPKKKANPAQPQPDSLVKSTTIIPLIIHSKPSQLLILSWNAHDQGFPSCPLEVHVHTTEMGPLSIETAVVGLLKTAQQVSLVIAKLISSKKNGSKEIKDVKTTVDTLR